jgi:hypothetical protein
VSEGMLERLAMIAESNMDPIRYTDTKDPIERQRMEAVSDRVHDRREKWEHNLAVQIANEVARLFK